MPGCWRAGAPTYSATPGYPSQVIDVSGGGAYSPESLSAHADMHTTLLGIPLSGTGEVAAHRLSATCPADAKKG